MKIRKITALLTSLTIAAGAFGALTASADSGEMRDITTAELVHDMGIGINLGNTFESCGDWINNGAVKNYETAWGSVEITEDIIKGYAAEGFGTLRIPVAWSNMMEDDGTYTVNGDYLARVKQVADWALDSGMYVIINEHWDYGWLNRLPEDKEEGMKKYLSIWSQVADAFKDCGDHLIFESQNEELGDWYRDENGQSAYYYWNREGVETVENGKQLAYDLVNEVNQAFVDLIRNSGGNNGSRHLLISGFNTDIDRTCDEMFVMPSDPAGRCAVSVHYYTPWRFALTNDAKTWGTDAERRELNANMDKLKERFVDNGVPVIIGECCNGSEISQKTGSSARDYFVATCEAAYLRGMCPVLWDITYSETQPADNQIYNRRTCQMQDAQLKAELQEIVSSSRQAGIINVEKSFTKQYLDEPFSLNASVNSGVQLKYNSSNEKVATVDENGTVTIKASGKTNIEITAEETEGYTAASATVELVVEKLRIDPNAPKESMNVAFDVTKVSQIKLPEGWTWLEDAALRVGVPVTVTARCDDTNFATRTVKITINRLAEGVDPDESKPDPTESSQPDTSSVPEDDDSSQPYVPADPDNSVAERPDVRAVADARRANRNVSRYEFRAVDASSSSSSQASSSSQTASAASTTTTAQPAAASDVSPKTGSAAGLTSIIALLFGAAYVVAKKNK